MNLWLPMDHDGEITFYTKDGKSKSIKTSAGGDFGISLDYRDISNKVLDTYEQDFDYYFDEPVNVDAHGGDYAGAECITVKRKVTKKPVKKVTKKSVKKVVKRKPTRKPVKKVTKKRR